MGAYMSGFRRRKKRRQKQVGDNCSVPAYGLWRQHILLVMRIDSCIQTPALLVINWGTLFKFSVSQHSHLKMGFVIITTDERAVQV